MYKNGIYTELERYVAGQVKPSRFAHCRSCGMTMKGLLERFPQVCENDPAGSDAGLYIGLWHDVARSWTDDVLLAYCLERNLPMESEEREQPMLLHGTVAAELMKIKIAWCPESWRTAVRWHTLGDVSMGPLGLAMYIADYLEPLRTHLADAHRAFLLSQPTMEAMAMRIIEDQSDYFKHAGISPAGCTWRLYEYMKDGGRL